MVNVFLKAWNPLIEFEQISLNTLAQGLLYWEALAPISERWKDLDTAEVSMGFASREELIKQRVLSDREFSDELTCYWQELKECVPKRGKMGKSIIGILSALTPTKQTVQRAFLTSFLVTYGYATLEIDRLEEASFHTALRSTENGNLNAAVNISSHRGFV